MNSDQRAGISPHERTIVDDLHDNLLTIFCKKRTK
jgi:hypothetical protein